MKHRLLELEFVQPFRRYKVGDRITPISGVLRQWLVRRGIAKPIETAAMCNRAEMRG